jgi:hypothetical protein
MGTERGSHFEFVAENFVTWPFSGQWISLERTDPDDPVDVVGSARHRHEMTDVEGTKTVMIDTWTWNLTLEPDAGQ